MARKTTRRRISIGDKPTPPPVKPKPKGPRSTSAKQAGQAAKFATKRVKPTPKPAPKPKPSVASQLGKAAVDAVKTTANIVNPAKKVTLAVTGAKAVGTALAKRTSSEIVKRPAGTVVKPVTTKPKPSNALARSGSRSTYSDRLGPMATGAGLAATGVMATRNPGFGSSGNKTTAAPKKKFNTTMSHARQEVALTKRAQEKKKEATGTPKKKITAKQTAYRETRRWGTSREAFQLSKANRSRPRGQYEKESILG